MAADTIRFIVTVAIVVYKGLIPVVGRMLTQIVVDNEAVQKETAAYQPIPEISSFLDENGNDTMEQQIQANYRQIKQDIVELVENELIRIENDPELKHLLGGN